MESIEIPLQKFPLSDSPNRFVEVAQHPKFPERYGEVTRVLLINPVQVDLDHIDMNIAKNRRYYVYPPYALGILNTLTRRRGIECRIIDLNYEAFSFIKMVENPTSGDLKAHLDSVLMSMILEFSPQLVGISCTFTMNHVSMAHISAYVRALDSRIFVVAGGVHVTNAVKLVLRDIPEVDFAITHEAEETFISSLDYLNGCRSSPPLNLYFRGPPNQFLNTGRGDGPSGSSLDIIPDYDQLPIGSYSDLGEIGTFRFWRSPNASVTSILSNKGCRARCSFCSVPNFNGKGVRAKSVSTVLDEISRLIEVYGVNHLTWLDDDLFFDPHRTLDLFEGMVARNLKVTWDASNGLIASAVVKHPELLDAAVASGCIGAYFGIESGSDVILKKVHKPSGRKHYLALGELLKKYPQVFSRGFLMTGFPGETIGQILETISLAREMELDWYTVQLLTPLPSTEIHAEMVGIGRADEDEIDTRGEGFTMFSVRESERQRKIESKALNEISFADLLEKPEDYVPTQEELNTIWFWMDYRINYARINSMRCNEKLRKISVFLTDVADRMTRDNALASHFLGYCMDKLGDPEAASRRYANRDLSLRKSEYWRSRFEVIGIDA